MFSTSLYDVLRDWSYEDLRNLCTLLDISTTDETGPMSEIELTELIVMRIKWLYHSRTVAEIESTARKAVGWMFSKVAAAEQTEAESNDLRQVPTYDELLVGGCKHLDAYEEGASVADCEEFLSHAVIIAALQRMKPRERQIFFERQVDVAEVTDSAGIQGHDLSGPATTFAMLGAAQLSGFGIYAASTTALGFLTHAVGITLPFAVYTGMTSTIAFIIGPAGWLAAGLWGAWKLTQAEWKKLIPALVYIIAVNSRERNGGSGPSGQAPRGDGPRGDGPGGFAVPLPPPPRPPRNPNGGAAAR